MNFPIFVRYDVQFEDLIAFVTRMNIEHTSLAPACPVLSSSVAPPCLGHLAVLATRGEGSPPLQGRRKEVAGHHHHTTTHPRVAVCTMMHHRPCLPSSLLILVCCLLLLVSSVSSVLLLFCTNVRLSVCLDVRLFVRKSGPVRLFLSVCHRDIERSDV